MNVAVYQLMYWSLELVVGAEFLHAGRVAVSTLFVDRNSVLGWPPGYHRNVQHNLGIPNISGC